MKIGNIEITGKSVLAPLAGITDPPFRSICKGLGAALVYTEMISAEGLVRNQRATIEVCESTLDERPVNFQLFGKDPASLGKAAGILSRMGADIIDINMGCPARKVTGGGSGSALLKDLDLARRIIGAVVEGSSVPVTVKIRTGWGAEDFVAVELSLAAEALGVAAVAVHGRYARQGFSGRADWSAIKAVKDAVGIPVIGNGDVECAYDAGRMLTETGCDLVMIGRGTLGNPWIFREVNAYLNTGAVHDAPEHEERGAMLIAHMRAVVARKGEGHGVKLMRKHAAWYAKGIEGAAEFRRGINTAETITEFESAVDGLFSPVPASISQSSR